MRHPLPLSVLLATLSFSAACGDETKSVVADTSASADPAGNPVLGGQLGEALKAVPDATSQTVAKGDPNAPPPGGIFPPGMADRALAAGAAPKVEVFADGSDPRIMLHASVPQGSEKITLLAQVSLQGKSLLPPLVFQLELGPAEAESPEAGAGAPKAALPAASAAPVALGPLPATDHALVAKVAKVELPGGNEPPKQLAELIEAMKGATMAFTMTPTGPTRFTRQFAKQEDEKLVAALDLEMSAVEDALTALYTPSPGKAVGEGAYWMVTDRRTTLGTDIVRYRVFKVEAIDGDQAILDIQTRQYAASNKSALIDSSGMQDPVFAEYQAHGEGKIQVGPGSRFPKMGQTKTDITAQVAPGASKDNPQGPRGELSFQIIAQIGSLPPMNKGPGAPGGKKKPPRPAPAPR